MPKRSSHARSKKKKVPAVGPARAPEPDVRRHFLLASPVARTLFVVLAAAYVLVAARYIYRTSIVVEGERVFTLWDDAMVSMRYAHDFAIGRGLVWNEGERVQGYTNLGLTLLMAALHLLPVSANRMPLVFQILSLPVLVAIPYFTAELTARLAKSAVAGAVAALVVALYAPLGIWGIQGADSAALALVLVVAATKAAEILETRERSAGVYWTLAVGVLVRLDFALIYLAFLGFLVWGTRERKRHVLYGAAVLAATVSSVLLFGWLYYGDPLPNTYYLKATGIDVSSMYASGFRQLTASWGHFSEYFWITGAMFTFYVPLLAWRSALARLLVAVVLLVVAYFVRIGGDWVTMHFSRFLVPAIPLYASLIVGAAWSRWRELLASGSRRWMPVFVALHIPLLVLGLNRRASLAEWWSSEAQPMYKADNAASLAFARFLSRYTRSDTVIGVFWAGIMPYHTDRRMLDLLGKSDARIGRARAADEPYWPGHAKRDWDYVFLERKPDVFVGEWGEMRDRDDYRQAYCVPPMTPVAIIVRRESMAKITYPRVGCD